MKRIIVIIQVMLLGIGITVSFAQKETAKMEYVFPEAMPQHIREMYLQNAEKGLTIYRMACARCHSSLVKKKEVIPDFTPDQLETYQIRMSNAVHESELQESALTPEELSLITIFFTYKKRG